MFLGNTLISLWISFRYSLIRILTDVGIFFIRLPGYKSQTILAVFAFFLLEVKSYLLSKISLVLTPKTTAKFVFFLRKKGKKKIFFPRFIIHLAAGVSSYVVSHLTREVTHIVRLSLTRKHERQLGGLYSHKSHRSIVLLIYLSQQPWNSI